MQRSSLCERFQKGSCSLSALAQEEPRVLCWGFSAEQAGEPADGRWGTTSPLENTALHWVLLAEGGLEKLTGLSWLETD